MGTQVSLVLPAERSAEGPRAERLVATWAATCTRFDPNSELSRLNAAGGHRQHVSELLFNVLVVALQAAGATDGLFDPTLLPSLEAIGYDRDFDALADGVPGGPQEQQLPATGGWRAVDLDPDTRTVLLPPGVRFDLGGLAKGMAVDAVIADLVSRDVQVAAVDAGGDLAVLGLPPGAGAWPIEVDAPGDARQLNLTFGALATSSRVRRTWRQGSEVRHHLIDPRSGLPSTVPLWSVSVAASTCAQAEVAAKAAFLLGPAEGSRFLASHDLAGLFLSADGTESRAGRWLAS
jgi:FAD:protein FMN transferase